MSEQLTQTGIVDPSAQLGAAGFDVLHEPEAIAATVEMFQSDQLLARALEPPAFSRYGMDHSITDNELDYMGREGGMKHVSSTLLVKGENIRVYKHSGFLVDSTRTTVEHIASEDSGSSTGDKDELIATPTDITTLTELADQIRDTHTKDMNEVNITLTQGALRGLFATDYPYAKLNAFVTQQHLRREGHGSLPLFVYDQEQGTLLPWTPTGAELDELIERMPRIPREQYTGELAKQHDITGMAEFAGSVLVTETL